MKYLLGAGDGGGYILEIFTQIHRVSGIETFSRNLFLHPTLSPVEKKTMSLSLNMALFKEVYRCGVIYNHVLYSPKTLVLSFLCLLLRKKIIFVSHGNLIVRKKGSYKKTVFLGLLKSILFFTDSETQFLNSQEAARSRKITRAFFLCPPYVDGQVRQRVRRMTDEIRLGYLGADYIERKGFDRMASFLGAALSSNLNVELIMAGFEMSPEVEEHFNRTKTLGSCSVCGPLYGAGKEKFWDEIDVLLLFSRSEGWPMVVLEAILHEVPILLSHETNVADFVEQHQVGKVVSDFKASSSIQALLGEIGSFESAWSAHVAHQGFEVLRSKLMGNP